ncbi:MAG: energy-coupling factor transporter transmembrane protein EcfT, partial [Ureaplasma sp.]|nr:energy-coupling factor transporter transmembrane protein EcfT [Ureaplasma sp.]
KSMIFLFLILTFINWLIYKSPISVFSDVNHFSIYFGSRNWISGLGLPSHTDSLGTSYVSELWGGNVIGYINPMNGISINGVSNTISDIFLKSKYNLENAQSLFNTLNQYSKESLLSLCNNNSDLAAQYYYIINNGFLLDGQKYSIQILSNTNNGLLNDYSCAVYQSYWYTLSPQAIQLSLYVSIKVLLMILASSILTFTTSSIELAYALEDILSPLKIFRFPIVESSMIIAIALRFVPSILSESQRIINAQSSRGIDLRNGNLKDKFKAIISLVVPLFNIAFIQSADLANAMESRGYNTRYSRTRYRLFKLNFADWIVFALLCLVMGFFIGIMIKPLLFTPFGIFELGILLG